jgi:hypothetical protein
MQVIIQRDIPFRIDKQSVFSDLRIRSKSHKEVLDGLVAEAMTVASPKMVYRTILIDDRGEDHVTIAGVRINSRVLRVNLEGLQRVFPYIVTGGVELEQWAKVIEDPLHRFWADHINGLALSVAYDTLVEDLETRYQTGPTASANPGSTIDWPMEGQTELFGILGDLAAGVGVSLGENYWMSPNQSTSGIRFASDAGDINCALCPMESCSSRQASYDPGLYQRQYAKKAS